jgi:alkylation response protein AidB-like acyl-CoA dehydrogenase
MAAPRRIDVSADFGFTEEHDLLRREARRFLSERCPISEVRRLADGGAGADPGLWKEIARLGWIGLVLPERYGGAGLGHLHLALLLEEMGRRLVPGPFLATLLAGIAIERGGSEAQRERWLPEIASGNRIAALAATEADGAFEAEDIGAAAEPAAGGFRLRGAKAHVIGGAGASLVVAPFREPDGGLALFAVELPCAGVSIDPEVGIDPTRPTARIVFEDARVPRECRLDGEGGAALAWRATLVRALAALSAEIVGGAEATLLMTRDYAIERKQFDRPIGFFQAVKYPIVDMMVGVELARSLALAAAAALDEGSPTSETAARMAKALASETFANAVRKGVQLHGGYGFTWDCDVHFYFRRALLSRPMLGDAMHHRARLARELFGDGAGD